MMLNYRHRPILPWSLPLALPLPIPLPDPSELPDSDDTPVDNDLQIDVPNLLRQSLKLHWRDRQDYYFGINIGIYHNTPGFSPRKPIVPDGFLSLGVEATDDDGRLSYIVWEEQNIIPTVVLECVSKTYGGEYDDKKTCYRQMGVLNYIIYNPHRYHGDSPAVLEVYRLVKGQYKRQRGPRFWLPELDLALGREVGDFEEWEREWLYWYDREGRRLPTQAERAERAEHRAEHAEQQVAEERQRAELAEHRAERLAALLRAQGFDPDQLS